MPGRPGRVEQGRPQIAVDMTHQTLNLNQLYLVAQGIKCGGRKSYAERSPELVAAASRDGKIWLASPRHSQGLTKPRNAGPDTHIVPHGGGRPPRAKMYSRTGAG